MVNNGSLQSHVEEDDDFSSGYFDNPMSSLGGLDLDDSDPLSMAIGGLGLSLESPNRYVWRPYISIIHLKNGYRIMISVLCIACQACLVYD
jgi:hypothetical protein